MLVKVLIQCFCLAACILYIFLILSKPARFKERRQVLDSCHHGATNLVLGELTTRCSPQG